MPSLTFSRVIDFKSRRSQISFDSCRDTSVKTFFLSFYFLSESPKDNGRHIRRANLGEGEMLNRRSIRVKTPGNVAPANRRGPRLNRPTLSKTRVTAMNGE